MIGGEARKRRRRARDGCVENGMQKRDQMDGDAIGRSGLIVAVDVLILEDGALPSWKSIQTLFGDSMRAL